MINNNMNEITPPVEKPILTEVVPVANKLPDELSGIHVEARFKISDPTTGITLVEGRA